MSDIDKRMQEAFESMHAPADLKRATLARIEEERAALAQADSTGASVAARELPQPVSLGAKKAKRPVFSLFRRGRVRMVAGVAACFVAAFVGVGGYAYATAPVASVGIDINPSIELDISRFDRVVDARALNEDAEAVLAAADVEGKTYGEAARYLAAACEDYLGEGALVEIGVSCSDEARCEAIESESLRSFGSGGAQVHCGRMAEEDRQEAASSGMSLGRYRLYQALCEAGVSVTAQDASSMPMRDLRALAESNGVSIQDSACCGHGATEGCAAASDACAAAETGSSHGGGHHGEGGHGRMSGGQ